MTLSCHIMLQRTHHVRMRVSRTTGPSNVECRASALHDKKLSKRGSVVAWRKCSKRV